MDFLDEECYNIVMPLLAAALMALLGAGPVSTANLRPKGLSAAYEAIPLGEIRVTKYTHIETHSRLTSSGHILTDADEGKVCAISRDWWRKTVKPGDLIWISGYAQPCKALDTMALRNPKGLRQLRWVDIYITDRQKGLDFGIRRSTAYLLRPTGKAKGSY